MKQTRRQYLAATGAVAVGTGLAGCLGGGGPPAAQTSHSCELTERDAVSELPQPRLGPEDTAVTVAVFEDFACPHCATFATGAFSTLKDEFADDDAVAFEHYDFPIPVSDWSGRVANAARSIQEAAGDEAFFAFSEAAYASQDDYSWQVVGDLAEDVDVDPCRALSDATYDTYEAVLDANREEGSNREIPGTPAVFVNGQLTDATEAAITSAIESNR
jgi:protein-disulfide isomerase